LGIFNTHLQLAGDNVSPGLQVYTKEFLLKFLDKREEKLLSFALKKKSVILLLFSSHLIVIKTFQYQINKFDEILK